MHEISAVLAGTYSQPDYAAAQNNINGGIVADAVTPTDTSDNSANTTSVDPRRYSKFDRTASTVTSTTDFSFSDFVDMVNPLQHIPVISSVYRSIEGESINPVSRIAGDAIYGGAFGLVSAAIGGAGAAANSVIESEGGKDIAGTVVASLFGDSSSDTTSPIVPTQVASAATAPPSVAAVAAPPLSLAQAASSATPPNPNTNSAASAKLVADNALAQAKQSVDETVNAAQPVLGGRFFAVPRRGNQAFGGDMTPSAVLSRADHAAAMQDGVAKGFRIGNTIYPARNLNTARAMANLAPVAGPAPAATPAATVAVTPNAAAPVTTTTNAVAAGLPTPVTSSEIVLPSSTASSTPMANIGGISTPSNLSDDALIMRALGQYSNVANNPYGSNASKGSMLDVVN